MEEKTVVIPATPETKAVTPPVEPTKPDKTLTQQEVDAIVRDRLSKQKEQIFKNIGFESADALKKKLADTENVLKEYETTKAELEVFRSEKTTRELTQKVQDLGVDKDFISYVLNNVKNDENFEANVKSFLEANPKIKADNFIAQSSNPSLNKGGQVDIYSMSTKEFLDYRAKNPIKL